MVPATRPIICLTECSRSGESMRPRKYFWATMLVAFCDQLLGNSTPSCLNAGLAGSPIRASRISHSTQSKGCLPASVKRRGTLTPSPVAGTLGAAALRLWDMTSPPVGTGCPRAPGRAGCLRHDDFAGTTDAAPRTGRNGRLDRELVLA